MAKYLTFVAVGDADSKKSELLMRYTGVPQNNEFFLPRFENNVQDIIVDSAPYSVHFIDAETDDDYATLRAENYKNADCVLLCYSIASRKSFESVSLKWCLEIRKHAPFAPIILIGTDCEARANNTSAISVKAGENLKLLIGAYALIECSLESFLRVDDIFIQAVRSTYAAL